MNSQIQISTYISEIFGGRTSGIIHSMFLNSINIMVDDELININSKKDFLSSFGMIVPKSTIEEILRYCETGNVVIIKNREILLYGRDKEVKISLINVNTVNMEIPKLSPMNVIHSKVIDKLESLELSEKIGIKNTIELDKMIKYLSEKPLNDLGKNEEIMKYLIGRGKGLTPSGDDFLVGFTMMLKSIDEAKQWSFQLEKLIHDQTTDISLAYYKALFAGYLSSYLNDFIQSIERLEQKKIDENIITIVRFGSTSGYDTLFGVYIACQWVKNNIIKKEIKLYEH